MAVTENCILFFPWLGVDREEGSAVVGGDSGVVMEGGSVCLLILPGVLLLNILVPCLPCLWLPEMKAASVTAMQRHVCILYYSGMTFEKPAVDYSQCGWSFCLLSHFLIPPSLSMYMPKACAAKQPKPCM